MREFLGSPMWQFVGTLLGLLAIVLSLILYYKQRQKKALSYIILSDTPLLNVGGEIRERVKILFDDEPIEDVDLFIVKIKNSGSVPIVKTDYEHRVKFNFGENAKILSSEIIETEPENLPAKVHIQEKKVVCDSILLNAGDSITVKVLVSGKGDITVDCRIQGVKEIVNTTFEDEHARFTKNFWFSMASLIVVAVISVFLGVILELGRIAASALYWGTIITVATLLIIRLKKRFAR